MTNQEYHSKIEFLSKSLLDQIHRSPAHYQAYISGVKTPPTPTQIFGSLVHSVILEQDNYAIAPQCDRRTKEGKLLYEAFLIASEGKELIVTPEQHEQALLIAQAVLAHPKAAALLQDGIAEQSYFGDLEGVPVKCRADYYNKKHNVIVDLKTTINSSPVEFAKSVYNYRYHVQAAFYLDIIRASRFFFIAVEKEAPYNVEVYELDDDAIERGRADYLADIETYKECKESGNWYGYTADQDIHILRLPSWAK